MIATGTGTTLSEADVPIGQLTNLLIIKPQGSVSTAEAYAEAQSSCRTAEELTELLAAPDGVGLWPDKLGNDFTSSVAAKVTDVAEAIRWLKSRGAVYAEMTGSGSAVFGIFPSAILTEDIKGLPAGARWHKCGILTE